MDSCGQALVAGLDWDLNPSRSPRIVPFSPVFVFGGWEGSPTVSFLVGRVFLLKSTTEKKIG